MPAVGLRAPGILLELSHQGDDDGYEETAPTLARPIPDSPVDLRTGHRFGAEEVGLGLPRNTF